MIAKLLLSELVSVYQAIVDKEYDVVPLLLILTETSVVWG